MDNLKELNTTEPVSVLGCKVPMSMKGQFIQLAAANKMNVNTQLAYMVQEFIQNGGKLDDGTKLKKLQDELTRCKADREQSKKDLQKSNTEAKDASKSKTEIDTLKKKIEALNSEIEILRTNKASAEKNFLNLSSKTSKTSEEITQLKTDLNTEKKLSEKLSKEVAELKKSLSEISSKAKHLAEHVISQHNKMTWGVGKELAAEAETFI